MNVRQLLKINKLLLSQIEIYQKLIDNLKKKIYKNNSEIWVKKKSFVMNSTHMAIIAEFNGGKLMMREDAGSNYKAIQELIDVDVLMEAKTQHGEDMLIFNGVML